MEPGGQAAGFYGSPVQVNALRSLCGIFHSMTSLCGKAPAFQTQLNSKQSFSQFLEIAGDFYADYVPKKLVY